MKITEEERYIFYFSAEGDVGQATLTLDRGNEIFDPFIKGSLYGIAVVAYCRPFINTKISDKKTIVLPNSFVPKEQLSVHKQILAWRNKMLARTDIDIRKPRLVEWSRRPRRIWAMQFEGFYPHQQIEYGPTRLLFTSVALKLASAVEHIRVRLEEEAPQEAGC